MEETQQKILSKREERRLRILKRKMLLREQQQKEQEEIKQNKKFRTHKVTPKRKLPRPKKREPRPMLSYWKPEALWPDSTIYILGGGPSLNDVNFDLFKDQPVIGVNNAYGDPVKDEEGNLIRYEPRDWVDVCWFGDGRWYQWHKKYLEEYKGLICSCSPATNKIKFIKSISRGKPQGIETNGSIAWNKSSGSSAINLAYYLGAKTIILVGFDMKQRNGQNNWHTDHKNVIKRDVYKRFLTVYPAIKEDADRIGLKILNANPDSAITVFPFIELESYCNPKKSITFG